MRLDFHKPASKEYRVLGLKGPDLAVGVLFIALMKRPSDDTASSSFRNAAGWRSAQRSATSFP